MIDTFPGLFWGYTAIWAVIVLYLIRLAIRISRLERRALKPENSEDLNR